jgi:GT2 family glycosyltransferase
VENISAACLMLRRDAILDVGLLDENFFMYFEDIDYCLRLRQAGWRLYYLRDGEIVHLVGQSSGGRMRNYSVHSYRSLFYFYRKHYSIYCLGLAKAMVWSLSGLRWLWNLGSGWMSGDRIHAQNRQDLRSIMNLCWSEPEDAAPSYRVALKTFEQHGLTPEKIHGTASLSGGKE